MQAKRTGKRRRKKIMKGTKMQTFKYHAATRDINSNASLAVPKAANQVSMKANASNYASSAGKTGPIAVYPTFNAISRCIFRATPTIPGTGAIQNEGAGVIPGGHGALRTGDSRSGA